MNAELKSALARLAFRMDLRVATTSADVGALSIDRHAGGYRLELIQENGGVRHLGPRVKSRKAFIAHLDFACDMFDAVDDAIRAGLRS